jgi:hypothetical protein
LIEMTVAATGTYNRHPLYVPVSLPGATLVSVPRIEQQVEEQTPSLATVLPFPESDVAPSAVTPPSDSGNRVASDGVVKKNDDDWDKLVGAEVTAFLAHAPSVEPARLSLVALGADLQSRIAKQVRSHWEILSLVGVASSVLMLLYVGWHAGPSRPWQPTMEVVHAAPAVVPVVSVVEPQKALVLPPTPEPTVPASHVPLHVARWGDRLVAQDTVREVGRHFKKASISQPIQAANKGPLSINVASKNKPLTVAAMGAKPVQPARVQTNPAPVKKITDLK